MTQNEQLEFLIYIFLYGELDPEKEAYLKKWIAESDQNKKEFERYKKILEEQRRHFPDQKVILSREKLKDTLLQYFTVKKKNDHRLIRGLSIAILIVSGLFIGQTSLVYPEMDMELYAGITSIETDAGETSSCILPDSTKIWLSHKTKIQYQITERNSNKIRQVKIDGDAFFDVAKKKEIPFEVLAGNTRIKVYGTQFYVNRRKDDLEITLVEGSMAVFKKNDDKISQLVPGDQVILDKQGNLLKKQSVDVTQIMLWKEGKYEFKDVTLEEIVLHLNKLYSVNITIKCNKLKKERFRCVIDRKKSLLQTLQILKATITLNYTINGSDILLTKN